MKRETAEVGKGRRLRGIVVSDSMTKSAIVNVRRLQKHPILGKPVLRRTKYCVHDPENVCRTGDIVDIAETRPISKRKSFVLLQVVESKHSAKTESNK